MNELLHVTLSNAVAATVLAIVAVVLGRLCRRPALTHGLWLLVLLKLVTPPLVTIRIPWKEAESSSASERSLQGSNPSPPTIGLQADVEVVVVGPEQDAQAPSEPELARTEAVPPLSTPAERA